MKRFLFLTISLFICAAIYFAVLYPTQKSDAALIKTPSPSAGSNSLKTGLMGWWTMDGGNTTATAANDKSGYGNNGTRTGGKVASGKLGQAMKFNGASDKITLGSTNFAATVSISVWVKTSSAAQRPILSNRLASNLYFGISSGKAFVYDDVSCAPSSLRSINNNTFHHVVWTNNGSASSFYIDGILDSSPSCSRIASTEVGYIGWDSPNNEWFPGTIDDLRIYNRVLTAKEIMQLYKMGGGKVAKTPTPSAGSNSLKTGLMGWWTMDGGDTTATAANDKSGYGNNGTRTGGKVTSGKLGQAMKFNGTSDYISMGSRSLGITNSLTFSAWIKPNLVSGSYYVFFSEGGFASGGYIIQREGSANKLRFASNGTDDWDSAVFTTNGIWQHVVVVVSNGTPTFSYINGVPTAFVRDYGSGTFSASEPQTVEIGRRTDTANQYFSGSIDDVRVYSRVLTVKEIMQLYKMGSAKVAKTPTPSAGSNSLKTGLVGWWTMDGADVTSTAALDKSGNGNNGARTGMSVVPGKIGQGLRINSSTLDVINVGVKSIFNPANITVAAWLKISSAGNYAIVAKNLAAPTYWSWLFQTHTTNGVYFIASVDGSNTFSAIGGASDVLSVNIWHHLAATYDGSYSRVYINGKQVGISTLNSGSLYNNNGNNVPLCIGGNNLCTPSPPSHLDDVRVYSRALSANEVMQLYKMGR